MSVFLPIKAFHTFYNSFSELLTPEGIKSFQEKLKSEGGSIFQSYGFSKEEQGTFIQSLNNPKFVLFHSWTEQNLPLFQLLTENKLHSFKDSAKHLQHQYAEEYKSFISPFLADSLLKFRSTESFEIRKKALSFCQLLDKNHNALVESQLFSPILQEVKNKAKSCQSLQEEKELITVVTPLCHKDIIQSTNYLSRASYSLKMEYVDAVLSVLKYKSCSPRFANWVLKELKQVELNNEHQYKINDLIHDLKKGDLQVRNHGKDKRIVKTSTILTFLAVLLLSSSAFWLVKYQPFSEDEEEEFSNETSFMQFSVEERKQLDSLLMVMNGNIKNDDLQIDQGTTLIGESDVLTVRQSFVNQQFETIHQDFLIDAEGRTYLSSNCNDEVDFDGISNTEKLSKRKGKIKAMMKNESDYDIIFVIAEETENGKIHSTLIKKGETISFKMKPNDVMFLVAGNHLENYKRPKNESKELPSEEFKQRFCYVDDNYYNSIIQVHQLQNSTISKVKFLLKGEGSSYFYLIDIHSVLVDV